MGEKKLGCMIVIFNLAFIKLRQGGDLPSYIEN